MAITPPKVPVAKNIRPTRGRVLSPIAGRRVALERTARQPIVDYEAEALRLGAHANLPVPETDLDAVLERVASDAVDLFGTREAALSYLETVRLTSHGESARQSLRTRGLGPVLGRLEDLRYGSRG